MTEAVPSVNSPSEIQSSRSSPAAGLFILWIVSTMALWAFAFLRFPTVTPEWFVRAQAACFGSNMHGLPNAGGWLMLIGSPLSLLLALLLLYWGEITESMQNLFCSEKMRLLGTIVLALLVVQIWWLTGRIQSALSAEAIQFSFTESEPFPENYPRLLKKVPEFQLTDQNGKIWHSQEFSKPYFLTFVFAHCSTMCPALIHNIGEASKQFDAQKIGALYITLDPWRDTPSALPGLAKEWKLPEGQFLLSGSPQEVNAALDRFEIPRSRDEKNGEVVHPALVYIIDSRGMIVYALNNAPTDWLKQAMQRVVAEPPHG